MNSRTIIYISIAVLVFLIILAWYFYRQGKKNALPPEVKLLEGNSAIPKGWTPVELAEELHRVMDDTFTLSGTKDEAWQKLIDLPTDDMVRSVYNTFNQLYFKENGGTLTQWIDDERYYDYTTKVKQKALKRLASLNLT